MTDKLMHIADTLPKNLLEAIGDIVVRWSRLQWQLSNLIAIGFDLPKDTGRALTFSMGITALCKSVRILTLTDRWIKDADLRKNILCLSEEIKDKSKNRNNYAHAVFSFNIDDPDDFRRLLVKSKQDRISQSSGKITLEQLKQLAVEAQSLVVRTADLTVLLKSSIKKSK